MRKRRLMPHQANMLAFMQSRRHSALFCQMRTGKSLPTIRFLQGKRLRSPRRKRILIVAPNSALGGWEAELGREGERDVAYLQGNRDQRLATLKEGAAWSLLNPEATWMVLPEIAGRERCAKCRGLGWRYEWKPEQQRQKCSGCGGVGNVELDAPLVQWLAVVVDESTVIKNPRASITQFLLGNLRNVPHRLILTGTPNPESDLDLWCQVAFLHGGAFGHKSYWSFRASAFEQVGYDWEPRPETKKLIERELARVAIRVTRKQAKMPDKKVRETRYLEMPPQLRKAYDTAERDYILEYEGKEHDRTMFSCARWIWMRRMCGGFLDGELVWDGKIKEMVSLLGGELAREQVVVWFRFDNEIDACAEALENVGVSARVMRGKVAQKRRRLDQTAFEKGTFRIFLIQQKVGEFGDMRLHAADTAIFFSRHTAFLTNEQTEDRIIHMSKGDTPMLYVDLAVRDSVDEDVAELVRKKRWRAGDVFGRMRARAGI